MASKTMRTETTRRRKRVTSGKTRKAKLRRGTTKPRKELFGDTKN